MRTIPPAVAVFFVLAGHASTPAAWVHRPIQAAENSQYRLVENWVHFPPEVTKWSQATGVDVDSHDNVFVFHRNELMPIMAFDTRGNFIRAWGRGMFKTTHFLRVDRSDAIWVTDRGYMEAFKFNREGKLLLTLGKQDVLGDNTSHDTFNGMADLAVMKNGDICVADGEGPNTRVAKFAKDGAFIKWWGGKGTEPGQFNMPHSIAVDSRDRIYVADRSNNRFQVFKPDGAFVKEVFVARNTLQNEGTVHAFAVSPDKEQKYLYIVDGSNKAIRILDRRTLETLGSVGGHAGHNAREFFHIHDIAADSKGNLFLGEVNNGQRYYRYAFKGMESGR